MKQNPDIANRPPTPYGLTPDVELVISHPAKPTEPFRVTLGTLRRWLDEGALAPDVEEITPPPDDGHSTPLYDDGDIDPDAGTVTTGYFDADVQLDVDMEVNGGGF